MILDSPYVSKTTHARLVIPRILHDSVSRALYLDADLLVLDDLGGRYGKWDLE